MNNPKYLILLLCALAFGAPLTGKAESLDLDGATESDDESGDTVASGDFNCDGFDDLAVGAPREDYSVGGIDTGAVNIIYGGTGSGNRLGTPGNQVFTQGHFTPAGPEERFGAALASGDFNNDNCDDLAIGIPHDKIGGIPVGGVVVVYGALSGFQAGVNSQQWDQDSSGIAGVAEEGDSFGWALAAGDFDNDGYDDLAIGAPFEDVDGLSAAGAVNVLYGSALRLTASGNQMFHSSQSGMQNGALQYEHFGETLAAGDFDGNGHDDLAIAMPGRDYEGQASVGAVRVLYGNGSAGLSTASNQLFQWGTFILFGDGISYLNSYFGKALAVGDFNADNRDDLAIGVPGHNGGAVEVLYSNAATNRLSTVNNYYLHRDSVGVVGNRVPGEDFGESLAVGDFDNDTYDDLVVGVPEDILGVNSDGERFAGSIHIFYGISTGLSPINDLILDQSGVGAYSLPEFGDRFGNTVACGDFNGDNYDDVVIGVPHEGWTSSYFSSGITHVLYSNAQGVNATDNEMLRQ
jgi:hypothetical protein